MNELFCMQLSVTQSDLVPGHSYRHQEPLISVSGIAVDGSGTSCLPFGFMGASNFFMGLYSVRHL